MQLIDFPNDFQEYIKIANSLTGQYEWVLAMQEIEVKSLDELLKSNNIIFGNDVYNSRDYWMKNHCSLAQKINEQYLIRLSREIETHSFTCPSLYVNSEYNILKNFDYYHYYKY